MIKFLDGPAEGVTLQLHRAPIVMRVVRDADGKWDALDQVHDQPKPGETVYLYRAVTVPSVMHLSMSDRSKSGWYWTADYRFMEHEPRDVHTWTAAEWDNWCHNNKDRLMEQFLNETGYQGEVGE